MNKYYKAEDIQELITVCIWRMTLAKERNGEGFVEYDKQIIDVGELEKRLSDLPTIEVSEDCISRVTALDIAVAYVGAEMVDRMLTAPSVIPKPKEGEWINKQEEYQMAECSNCKKVTMHEMWGDKLVYYDYCPNCGAKMKGADDES